MINQLRRFLPVLVIIIVVGLMTFGMLYFIKNEEANWPAYEIRQDGNTYRTDSYSLDSVGCINFIDMRTGTFSSSTTERPVILCGKFSIVKIK